MANISPGYSALLPVGYTWPDSQHLGHLDPDSRYFGSTFVLVANILYNDNTVLMYISNTSEGHLNTLSMLAKIPLGPDSHILGTLGPHLAIGG